MNDDSTTISQMLPDVPLQYLPSKWQFERCRDWVDWAGGADPVGNFNGHCLLHDPGKETISAVYNFDRGVMRCQREPSCHSPKRAVSIINALKQASER